VRKITKIEANKDSPYYVSKLRVAAYCRVSTNSDEAPPMGIMISSRIPFKKSERKSCFGKLLFVRVRRQWGLLEIKRYCWDFRETPGRHQ